MDLNPTKEQKDFRIEVRNWLKENIPKEPLPSMDTQEGFELHRAWEKKLFENRWSVIAWPEKYGGRDLSVSEWLIFEESITTQERRDASTQMELICWRPLCLISALTNKKIVFYKRWHQEKKSGRKDGQSQMPEVT